MVKVNYQFEKRKKELDKKRKKEQKLRLKQQKKNSQPPGEVTVEPQVESSTETPAVTPQDALPVETPEK